MPYKLISNKTKFYNLVKEKLPSDIPIMKETEFMRVGHCYFLHFYSANKKMSLEAFMSGACGDPYLCIYEEGKCVDSCKIPFDYLHEKNMLVEVKQKIASAT